jgi:hypothetical protein
MPTTTSPPILIWEPGGGTPTWTPAPPPAGHAPPENGLTVLTIGQNYVDVVFVTTQPRADWTFAGLEVVNVTDTAPLNIWVGVATSKTRSGFRVYLNGLPDTGNYYLDWTINGGTVATAGTATTYLLSGPDSGPISSPTTFTVALPIGTTVEVPVTVTPDDGGVPGTFSPATVALTSDMPSANFVYTPGSYGARTITVTNDSLLTDPGALAFTAVATTYLLTGPSTGPTGVASTNFTVSLPVGGVVVATVIVTPTDALPTLSAGTFTPTSVNLTTGAPSATFTYTPLAIGAKTISVTNNRGLTNPANLTYTATVPPVSIWHDSSGNGNHATQSGTARPAWVDNVVNGKPVVRFTSAALSVLNLATTIPAVQFTCFTVMKRTGASIVSLSGVDSGAQGIFSYSTQLYTQGNQGYVGTTDSYTTAWHVWTGLWNPGTQTTIYLDGTNLAPPNAANPTSTVFSLIGAIPVVPVYSDGDIAEIIIYNSPLALRAKLLLVLTVLISTGEIPSPDEAEALLAAGNLEGLREYLVDNGVSEEQAEDVITPMAVGDRANIEKYLGTKYGITVAGGTAVDPSTVVGLVGWWKADSL